MLPALLAARAAHRKMRIWCAAASTGQEPYTIAMILKDMEARLAGWRIEILATDLSTEVLDRAKAGLYTQFEVQRGLPIQLLMKHFTQKGDMWEIEPAIRSMVQYRPLNLLRDFAALGQFDIVYLPQRPDLFRPGHEDRRPVPHRPDPPAGRLSGARRGRDGGRAHRAPSSRTPSGAASMFSIPMRRGNRVAALPTAGFARMR